MSLMDHELELVEPATRYVDEMLAACHHALTVRDMPVQSQVTRETLNTFILQNPRGRTGPDASRGIAPGYTFWMRIRAEAPLENGTGMASLPETVMAGSISLRIGHSPNLDMYLGHIGYHVLPPARGHRYAERACRMLLPLARYHGHRDLWITCNPENAASRKTCERLGGEFVSTGPVPRENSLYGQGDREKCRYRIVL